MEEKNIAEEKLNNLSHAVNQGWAKQFQLSNKLQEAVRDTVQKQWELDQIQSPEEKTQAKQQRKNLAEEQAKKREQERGHDRGRSL